MLAPGEAIERAHTYLEQVIPDFAGLNPKVEEMVFDKDSANWNITFSAWTGPEKSQENTLADLLRIHRVWKVVSIGADDGSFVGVKNPS